MNIGKTLESLNSLINKKQRKRISRHSKFMKQQKRTLAKTLKQDKLYRQQLHNYQEDMFNSTIKRTNTKTKNQGKCLDEQNDMVFGDSGNDTIQSRPLSSQIRELANVKIVISKLVIDPSNQPDGGHAENLSNWMGEHRECVNEFETRRRSTRMRSSNKDH